MAAVGSSHVLFLIVDAGFAVFQMTSFTSCKLSTLNTLSNPLLLILAARSFGAGGGVATCAEPATVRSPTKNAVMIFALMSVSLVIDYRQYPCR
jgi:hypothetical protein